MHITAVRDPSGGPVLALLVTMKDRVVSSLHKGCFFGMEELLLTNLTLSEIVSVLYSSLPYLRSTRRILFFLRVLFGTPMQLPPNLLLLHL